MTTVMGHYLCLDSGQEVAVLVPMVSIEVFSSLV